MNEGAKLNVSIRAFSFQTRDTRKLWKNLGFNLFKTGTFRKYEVYVIKNEKWSKNGGNVQRQYQNYYFKSSNDRLIITQEIFGLQLLSQVYLSLTIVVSRLHEKIFGYPLLTVQNVRNSSIM